jgi:DNA-binding NarL/FixJ family response regulator
MSVRVAVADDQALIREGIRSQLGYVSDMDFVGAASNGAEAVKLAMAALPDVLLMDVRMPILDGISATRKITSEPICARVRILVLTTFHLDEYVYDALTAGASGFLLKDCTPEELVQGIRVVDAGESLLAPAVTTRLVAEIAARPRRTPSMADAPSRLTEREREVLVLVAEGLSNAEIASRLVLSPLTAKTHVSRILTKLGMRDRAQLVVVAYEAGLVVPGRP